jgi:GT2 family glycosyltransferase
VKSLLSSRRRLDEIIVVDNSGDRACKDALSGVDSSVSCVASGRNLGFSGGMNAGIRAVLARGADAVLLVNSDVIVPPDCAGILERQLDRPGTGIVGPVLRSRSDPRRITSLGMKYSASTGRMRHVGAGESVVPVIESGSRAVDAISGCVMLVRRAVFEKIGLLPEDYFFSFEDLDFCLNARDAGYATILAAEATAYHEGSRSIGADSSRRLYFAARNHLLVASRRSPAAGRPARFARAVSIVAFNIAHAVISAGGTLPSRLQAVARGTRDHVAGRYGSDG